MGEGIPGIHHVTAICSDAQRNIDFYCNLLGLRLVKLTVNFDDPGAYHLYYGDELGRPGSVLTFFAWPGARQGRNGTGQVNVAAFSVPAAALSFWQQRLQEHGIATEQTTRFGEPVLSFKDHDEMQLELVASAVDEREAWHASPVPPEYSIRGFHSVAMCEEGYERTAQLLTDTMGFRLAAQEGNRFRYETGDGTAGTLLDVLCQPDAPRGQVAVGNVHHIAWRVPDNAAQTSWHAEIASLGYNVSPIMDRTYFNSIYFREPGGVLFEIATDNPGFTVDEAAAALGTQLKLPSPLEPHRARIEMVLPPVALPTVKLPQSPS
jgi:catechol 2,3-dioxygenase-like lactoylglutathione lyase family enzyme